MLGAIGACVVAGCHNGKLRMSEHLFVDEAQRLRSKLCVLRRRYKRRSHKGWNEDTSAITLTNECSAAGAQLWGTPLRALSPVMQHAPAAARMMSESASAPSEWAVVRSPSGQLPVYRDIRNHNTRELTVIRKVLGDLEALRASIVRDFDVDAKHVFVKAGRVEVKGRHKAEISKWLESKGF